MASVETCAHFLVNCPTGVSGVESMKAVFSSDNAVKWQVALFVKPKDVVISSGKFIISVEATAFSAASPSNTQFVYASCEVKAGHCTCRTNCHPDNHSYSTLKKSPVSNNFHFKMDGLQVPASVSTSNVFHWPETVATCYVKVSLSHYKTAGQEHPLLSPLDPYITKKLEAMLESSVMSDVTFVVDGVEFKAHSQILAAASDVFAAMFQDDTEDKRAGRFTVEDVHPTIFKEMLRCVYTDSEPEWVADDPFKTTYAHDFLVGLLLLAEKYMLVQLRGHCQRRLISTLTVDNVVPRLRAVNVASPPLVPLLADPFVRMHLAEIVSTESWQAFLKEDAALAASVMFNAINKVTTVQESKEPEEVVAPLGEFQNIFKLDELQFRPYDSEDDDY